MNARQTSIRFFITLFYIGISIQSKAQENKIDSLPFSLTAKLLVFKGQLNGKDANFAFDTGASESIANTQNIENNSIEIADKTRKVEDANLRTTRLKKGMVAELSIGNFTFKKVSCFVQDMQFLVCNDLYLLGADVIRQLNWKIDFNRKLIYFSKSPFSLTEGLVQLPVKYTDDIPFISLEVGRQELKNVMIDMGYTDKLSLPKSEKKISKLMALKQQKGNINYSLTSTRGLNGNSKTDTSGIILIDSILIGEHYFKQVPGTVKNNTNLKIGLGFFSEFCSNVIINNTNSLYALTPQNAQKQPVGNYEISVNLDQGKLRVIGKNLALNSTGSRFELNEEIESIDERKASSFKDECDFLRWYLSKKDTFTVKRSNGQIVVINKIALK